MCVRKVFLYGSETWPVMAENIQRLVTADNGMMKWSCGLPLKDCIPTTDLLLHLGLSSIKHMLRWNRLMFHRHLIRIVDDAWTKKTTILR